MADARKVLLLEFNEINWHVIDKLLASRGAEFLPHLAQLRERGSWGVQTAVERPPLLDPWITWVTLHTGVSPATHKASVLEQKGQTIQAKRSWHYVSEAGRTVGVFGSISAYPPPALNGFVVPGPFAPGDETHPPQLAPMQSLNRRYTQVHNKTARPPGWAENARQAVALIRLGLKPSTCLKIGTQLLRERSAPHLRWKRVALQPAINFDFFAALYRSCRPDFCTWHSNHAAHYMHHYWRAWDDSEFPVKATQEERRKYGEAVPHGYRVVDELIGRALRLIDEHTVLVVASSMGQQPYINEKYREGKVVVRIRDIQRLLDIVGRQGVGEVVPTMVPQWNLHVGEPEHRVRLRARLESAMRVVEGRQERAFAVSETGDCLTLTPLGLARPDDSVVYSFLPADGGPRVVHPIGSLFAMDTPTVKQGMHHVDGMLAFYGPGIPRGRELPRCTNLDVAPTLLSILGIPVPALMEGRVLQDVVH